MKKACSDRRGMDFSPLLSLINLYFFIYFVFKDIFTLKGFNILVPKLLNLIDNLKIDGHKCNFTVFVKGYAMCYVTGCSKLTSKYVYTLI